MILYLPTKGCEAYGFDYKMIFVQRDGEFHHIPVEELGPDEPAFFQGYEMQPVFRTKDEAIEAFREARCRELCSRIGRYLKELESYGCPYQATAYRNQ